MERQAIKNHGETEDEEFPNEFMCCVCREIVYKPVVLACGHISCFWCVFKAMDSLQESLCPVCRNPYNHFPRVCELLHFLLLKLYPRPYKRREREVAEEEKMYGNESPQFDGNFIDSRLSEVTDVQDISFPLSGTVPIEPTCEGGHLFIQDSSQRTSHEDDTITIPKTSSYQTTTSDTKAVVEHINKVLVSDLQCAVCKQLLMHPMVLNCGHVFCEACIIPHDGVCKCPVCQSAHPKGFPNVCLVLKHFLEEHFPEECSARKASLPHFQSGNPSGISTEKQEQAAQSSSVPTHVNSSLFSGNGTKCHPGAGCDYCGMYPIIGVRYRCKDCPENVGFDLCEGCHSCSFNLPGRFNQQHTMEHQFEVIQPPDLRSTILRLGENDGIHIVYLSHDAPENGLEIIASLNSPSHDPQDLENAMASPDPSNNHFDDSAN